MVDWYWLIAAVSVGGSLGYCAAALMCASSWADQEGAEDLQPRSPSSNRAGENLLSLGLDASSSRPRCTYRAGRSYARPSSIIYLQRQDVQVLDDFRR